MALSLFETTSRLGIIQCDFLQPSSFYFSQFGTLAKTHYVEWLSNKVSEYGGTISSIVQPLDIYTNGKLSLFTKEQKYWNDQMRLLSNNNESLKQSMLWAQQQFNAHFAKVGAKTRIRISPWMAWLAANKLCATYITFVSKSGVSNQSNHGRQTGEPTSRKNRPDTF